MAYFNFSNLITKYKSSFTVITPSEGQWNAGEWVEGEPSKTILEGAIISFKESKIIRSEGTLTTKDKRLFMLEKIDDALKGSKVIYDDYVYSIEDCTENAKFTNVYAYTLRYVSAFEEVQK